MSLSPLDGRYFTRVADLDPIVSEFGLMKYRTRVEIAWLRFLSEKGIAPAISAPENAILQDIYNNFSQEHFQIIKNHEKITNHDVKAVEYFLQGVTSAPLHPFIHWGCTSEDINNTAYALMLSDSRQILVKEAKKALKTLKEMARSWKNIPMLCRTHGQTATPSTMGKEFAVFCHRMEESLRYLANITITAKINGATGTFSAHVVGFPADWITYSQEFIEQHLNLAWNPLTTQIEPHDNTARILLELSSLSNIIIDLSRDVWGYVSLGYFGQRRVEGEVGSSTMPHKVNPIDFENAEGNLKLARGICTTLASELPISRWQRDLTDSTLQRNLGLPFGHIFLALKSLQKGLSKIQIREEVILKDLQNAPEVLTEAIQTVLRTEGVENAYELLKNFSRGKKITLEDVKVFVADLKISPEAKKRLENLTPEGYVGLSAELVSRFIK